jgi:hypothetical protein
MGRMYMYQGLICHAIHAQADIGPQELIMPGYMNFNMQYSIYHMLSKIQYENISDNKVKLT